MENYLPEIRFPCTYIQPYLSNIYKKKLVCFCFSSLFTNKIR